MRPERFNLAWIIQAANSPLVRPCNLFRVCSFSLFTHSVVQGNPPGSHTSNYTHGTQWDPLVLRCWRMITCLCRRWQSVITEVGLVRGNYSFFQTEIANLLGDSWVYLWLSYSITCTTRGCAQCAGTTCFSWQITPRIASLFLFSFWFFVYVHSKGHLTEHV